MGAIALLRNHAMHTPCMLYRSSSSRNKFFFPYFTKEKTDIKFSLKVFPKVIKIVRSEKGQIQTQVQSLSTKLHQLPTNQRGISISIEHLYKCLLYAMAIHAQLINSLDLCIEYLLGAQNFSRHNETMIFKKLKTLSRLSG